MFLEARRGESALMKSQKMPFSPFNEEAEKYSEFRLQRSRDEKETRTRTSEVLVQKEQSDTSSADDPMDFERTQSGRMQRGVQTRGRPIDFCCQMRVVKKETGKAEEQKEFVMCRNVAHMDRDDHCNPKRLYVVKRSTIPRTAKELSEQLCFFGKI